MDGAELGSAGDSQRTGVIIAIAAVVALGKR